MNKTKRKRWPWITGIVVVIIVAVVLLIPKGSSSAELNIKSATAENGNISVKVVGTGNLEYDDTVDIKVPSGIIVDKVMADSGDAVSAGDVLAILDPVSLKTETNSVQNQINNLDRQINASKGVDEPDVIKTSVSGRIKEIFAKEGDAVSDVCSENGALMILSIDGKMAVDFKSATSLSVGDKVNVILNDGTKEKGTIEKAGSGEYTATLTDNGPELDEAVTIKNAGGDILGTGTLYIHQPLNIVATYGTVKTIRVSENEKVSSGERLIILKDLPISADYNKLLSDRNDLLDTLNTLQSLSKTNAIVADTDGVIMDVNIKDGETIQSANTSAAQSGTTGNTSTSAQSGSSTNKSSTAQSASLDDSDDNKVVAFTVAPNENMVLNAEVNELDILSIKKDMEAEVAIDAIPDRTFSGKITEIADSATVSGSVAKYSVKVLIPKDASMRAGMNATATVTVDNKDNILMIPIVALQEAGGRVYVYTQKDPKTGALSGEVDVKTGISDGVNVEITSGLIDGSTVYYIDNSSNSTSDAVPNLNPQSSSNEE